MTVSLQSRTSLPQWSAGTDPFTRSQMNAAYAAGEANFALDAQGTLAARPAAGKRGKYYYATDTGQMFRDTGSAWIQLPTLGIANTFTAAQSINADGSGQQITVDTATAAGQSGVMVRRRTAADLSTWKRAWIYTTANRASFYAQANTDAGNSYNNDLTGMSGRWGINWGADTAPDDTLVIKNRAGTETARFVETGGLGLGVPTPIASLDVRTQSAGAIGLRVGGPVASGHDYAYSVTPLGAANAQHLSGATNAAGTVTARAASTTIYEQINATHRWMWDTGLTPGSTYSPTVRMTLDNSFSKSVLTLPRSDSRIGIGTAPGASLHIATDGEGGPVLDGAQAAIMYRNTAGTPKGLIGIRNDITGNTNDMVFYNYGGDWRVYNSGVEVLKILNSDASLRSKLGYFGSGALGGSTLPYIGLSDDGAFWTYIDGNKFSSTAHIGIRSNGAGGVVALRPEGSDALVASRAGGVSYAGAIGFMVAGANYPQTDIPGFRVRRFELANTATNGGVEGVPHDLGTARSILAVSAWVRGNSNESVACPVLSMDGSYVYIQTPGGTLSRTAWVGALVADTFTATWH